MAPIATNLAELPGRAHRRGASRRLTALAGWLAVALATASLVGTAAAQEPAAPAAQEAPVGQQPEQQQRSARAQREAAAAELQARIRELDPIHREWIQSVAGLITTAEVEYFLDLPDYRRDGFMEAFWEPRDPDPATPQNELRQRWEDFRRQGDALPFGDPRFVVYLLNGPPGRFSLPDGRPVSICYSRSEELEIWFYGGSELTAKSFVVVFFKRGAESAYEIYRPGALLRTVQRAGGLPTTDVRLLCADEVLRYALWEIGQDADYDGLIEDVLQPPVPSAEWLATLRASSTELPEGAPTFEITHEIRFPERNQSRTAMQVLLSAPAQAAPGRRFDGELHHNFVVSGEVIRDGRLFESFQYGFEGPTPAGADAVPMGFTRFLRPGPVTLRVLVEDVFGERYAQVVRDLEIPSPEGLPQAEIRSTMGAQPGAPGAGPSLQLLAPGAGVLSGVVRFSARHSGEIDEVTFFLDDRPVLTKRSPPYSVELNLGDAPAPHRVRVVGYSADDREIATDQLWLNQGAQRFRVRMIEPRSGGIYPGSLTARVEVDTPDGQPPASVEILVNDDPVATLVEPPYAQAVRLPGEEVAVVRAVATLADGTTAEDAVVVNASPDLIAEVEVRLVEVFALVLDRQGRPVRDLTEDEFRVLEEGQPQRIRRFEEAADAPLHAALVVDRSSSMEEHLEPVRAAAQAFAGAALRGAEDRVAVLSFAEETTVDQGFTASSGQVERALAGLRPLGRTALNDAVVESLGYFDQVEGRTALVLFTDGRDETSRFSDEQVLEAARRSGVMVYVVGLAEAFPDRPARRAMEELATQTGGTAHFLADLGQVQAVYAEILEELRARYLLAYQPPAEAAGGDSYRSIEVEVTRRDLDVRARAGYYP